MMKFATVIALSCAASVYGDGHSSAAITQAAWDNHGDAFMTSDVDKIMADYTEESEMVVLDFGTGGTANFKGLDAIRGAFTGLFEYLQTDAAHPEKTSVADLTVEAGQIFLAWRNAAAGVTHCTDTFIMDASGSKFATQTVTLWTTAEKPFLVAADNKVDLNQAKPDTGAQSHWDNHLDAFATGDLEKMVLDYREDAQIIEFDFAKDTKTVYTGIAGVRELFPKYFGWAGACGAAMDVALPIIRVEDANGGISGGGYIYLDVRFACAGIPKWTDTFVIDGDGMIVTQNIVFESGFDKAAGVGEAVVDGVDDGSIDCYGADSMECSQCACMTTGDCSDEATAFCAANLVGGKNCMQYAVCAAPAADCASEEVEKCVAECTPCVPPALLPGSSIDCFGAEVMSQCGCMMTQDCSDEAAAFCGACATSAGTVTTSGASCDTCMPCMHTSIPFIPCIPEPTDAPATEAPTTKAPATKAPATKAPKDVEEKAEGAATPAAAVAAAKVVLEAAKQAVEDAGCNDAAESADAARQRRDGHAAADPCVALVAAVSAAESTLSAAEAEDVIGSTSAAATVAATLVAAIAVIGGAAF